MWVLTPEGVYQSDLLNSLEWVRHGFGTRNSDGWPGEYTQLKQIHSNAVYLADDIAGCLGKGDALITRTPDRWVGVRTADCVPILLADPEKRVVAAVHAGWRGTVARIVARTVERMISAYGSNPQDLRAAIGPCIQRCCYEVGPEVAARFQAIFPEAQDLRRLDLPEGNRRQLAAAGVPSAQIDVSGFCSACDAGQFHSYRRDKDLAGRMVAAIQIAG
jgi:YfiH family protein